MHADPIFRSMHSVSILYTIAHFPFSLLLHIKALQLMFYLMGRKYKYILLSFFFNTTAESGKRWKILYIFFPTKSVWIAYKSLQYFSLFCLSCALSLSTIRMIRIIFAHSYENSLKFKGISRGNIFYGFKFKIELKSFNA